MGTMYGVKLTENEIKQQLQRGRNYERLYHELKLKYDEIRQENRQLRAQLTDQRSQYEATLASQAARIEQLEAMVFGRKPPGSRQTKLRLHPKRPAATYHRPIPPAAAVTTEERMPVDTCKHCGSLLAGIQEHVRYTEDIVLGALDVDTTLAVAEP